MKDSKDVIQEFNELVNMTASELETWLASKDSTEAGWSKDDNGEETVGHESGRKITEILKSNPSKDAQKYNDDQISHMRKVVAYCKRHLAQEQQSLESKSPGEAKKTKSYISLKNWGHDPLKKQTNGKQSSKGGSDGEKEKKEEEEVDGGKTASRNGDGDQEADKEAGEKRKRSDKDDAPEPKKQQTRQGSEQEKSDAGEDTADDDTASDEEAGENGKAKATSNKGPKPGETVSWNWGNGQPKGKVLDVKEEKATITTKRGNKVSREGDSDDPAVILDTGKSKAIKSAHELN
ncbi:DNA-binding protein [Cordyceps militaris CM01]|uniref:DNA-binding protein n=1 Tax=Cordyceps militaris (strain CM01) TaxID=983644 RepID=G3JB29_CORMM|nr:DNA-binding protein [Cordyceps militaris CM01]EGX94389.1 DNA-binding protein [Cordyceps militaris CM01]